VNARRPPELVVVIPLEGVPALLIHAESFEDEARLLLWLAISRSPETLSWLVARLLEDLDERKRAA
jgi:hypothetical protein